MLIRRCAWHRTYVGWPRLLGVVLERRWRVQMTDGLCRRCLARLVAGAPVPSTRAVVDEARRQLEAEERRRRGI
ncbi:MAG: hypothetical protein ACRDH5_19715 [bacterium]